VIDRTTINNTLRRSLVALTVAALTVVGMTGRAEAAGAPNRAASNQSTSVDASPAASSCPQPGDRFKGSASTIYLDDPEGFYDIIPDTSVYFSLWGSWSGIKTFSDSTLVFCNQNRDVYALYGAYFLGDSSSGAIYIFDATYGGVYRHITSMSIFNKFKFDISKVLWQAGAPYPIGLDWGN
jgi:hypothetical protein